MVETHSSLLSEPRVRVRLLWGLLVLAGCATPLPWPPAEEAIGTAVGMQDAVRLRFEPEPLDVPTVDASVLTLADAVRRALVSDPRIQMALARVQQALADAGQARLWPNPILSILMRFPEAGGTANVEAGLSASLLAILQTPRRTSAADHRLRAATARSVVEALDVLAEVQEVYASAQALDARVQVLEGRHRILQQLVQLARTKLEAGEGTSTEVATLDAQRVDLEVDLARGWLEQEQARLRLARLIGNGEGLARWSLESWRAPTVADTQERDWIRAALAHRPELEVVQWELAALGDDLALAGWSFLEGSSVGVNAERDGAWRIGPTASAGLPILDRGQARRDRVNAEIVEGRHRLTLVGRSVIEQVRSAFAALTRSRETLAQVRTELIPLQERRRALAEQGYRLGQSDVTAVFLAEQDLRAAETTRIELEEQVAVSLVRLHRAAGGPGVAATPGDRGAQGDRQ